MNKEAIEKLAELATRRHYWCDDGYYTCPAHEDGSSNPAYESSKECNCGADEHNSKVRAIVDSLIPKPTSKSCDRCGGKGFVVDRGFERICGACGGLGYEPI